MQPPVVKHHTKPKKIDWTMWAVIVPAIFAVVSWAISVEVRSSRSDAASDARMTKLETSVDSRVSKLESSMDTKLAKMDATLNIEKRVHNIEDLMTPVLVDWKVRQELKKHGISNIAPQPLADDEKKAQTWVKSQIPRSTEKSPTAGQALRLGWLDGKPSDHLN